MMTIGEFVQAYADIQSNTPAGSPEFYSDVEKLLADFSGNDIGDGDDYERGYAAGVEAARDALADL